MARVLLTSVALMGVCAGMVSGSVDGQRWTGRDPNGALVASTGLGLRAFFRRTGVTVVPAGTEVGSEGGGRLAVGVRAGKDLAGRVADEPGARGAEA